jgi:hypothetical protein
MTPGDTVTLKGTARRYRVEAIYCTNATAPEWAEEWARLTGPSGTAYWLLSQLEATPVTLA